MIALFEWIFHWPNGNGYIEGIQNLKFMQTTTCPLLVSFDSMEKQCITVVKSCQCAPALAQRAHCYLCRNRKCKCHIYSSSCSASTAFQTTYLK